MATITKERASLDQNLEQRKPIDIAIKKDTSDSFVHKGKIQPKRMSLMDLLKQQTCPKVMKALKYWLFPTMIQGKSR